MLAARWGRRLRLERPAGERALGGGGSAACSPSAPGTSSGTPAEGNRAVVDAFASSLEAEVATRRTHWVHRVSPEAVVGRVASSSRIAMLDNAEGRKAYLGQVRDLLDTHPDTRGRDGLDVAYVTDAYRFTPS